MKIKKVAVLIILALISALSLSAKERRVLVYTKNGEGYIHDNIAASVEALKKLGAENGFKVDVCDDPALFTDANLKKYNALIFNNTNNDVFANDEQRAAFKRYIQSGGGFVGIHSACGTERNWPWFWDMLGGKFIRHCPYQKFTVRIIDPGHPSTSMYGKTFEWEDEGYYLTNLNPDIHVLMAHDLTTITDEGKVQFPGNVFGELFPSAWCHEFDGGREWYTSYGHNPVHYQDPLFLRHLLGGIRWAMNVK
ncbi:MAG: ThuA domain-containing protein [Bacteroidota bacterium]